MNKRDLLYGAVFKLRGVLMVPFVVLLFACTRWEWECDPVIWPVGLAIFLPGLLLRAWAQRHVRYRLHTEPRLATSGPYAYVRNPVYLANMLMLAGLCVLCELVWMLPVTSVWSALVYYLAVKFEEVRLAMRFGESYARYCERVPAWFPHMRRASLAALTTAAGWGGAAAAEWQCPLLLAVPIVKECLN
jgi:protein-S-isoprenylcysteine O-methyltransferase Ste14